MEQWKKLTYQANQQFNDNNYLTALSLHQQAQQHAWEIFDQHTRHDPDGAIMMVLISYFNQADAYVEIDKVDTAGVLFEEAYSFLSKLLCDHRTSNSVKEAALKATTSAMMEWVGFIKKHRNVLKKERIEHYKTVKNQSLCYSNATCH